MVSMSRITETGGPAQFQALSPRLSIVLTAVTVSCRTYMFDTPFIVSCWYVPMSRSLAMLPQKYEHRVSSEQVGIAKTNMSGGPEAVWSAGGSLQALRLT